MVAREGPEAPATAVRHHGRVGTPLLELVGVTKHYGAVRALTDVSFAIGPGEIHALVGENGAGKSTLVGVITGLVEPTAGTVLLDGEPQTYRNPRAARAAGVVAVYQDPRLFPHLDIAENVFAGIYPRHAPGVINRAEMHKHAAALLARLGVDLDTRAPLSSLSVAEAQFVEIARALATDTRLLILDEPTAALTAEDTERLFRLVRGLREAGTSIIWISHRMEEIRALADTITVLRDGKHVRTAPAVALTEAQMVQLMVGRDVTLTRTAPPAAGGQDVLTVSGLSGKGAFEDISFCVRAGEIVTMAGLLGSGRTEIAETIFGLRKASAGTVSVSGVPVEPRSPRRMQRHGVAFLPENRDREGLITAFSVARNITLPSSRALSRLAVMKPRLEQSMAIDQIERLEIKTAGGNALVSSLSGGNRQKVAIARWLATHPKVLILDEPTHGIDVGTKVHIHELIRQLAHDEGLAVLVISSDLLEVLALSDRVLVLCEGRIAAEFAGDEATQESIMTAAMPQATAVAQ
ncbi:MAG: Ribose import ATP-binding protein RbsA [Actinomycetia bacterium]|jgi:rhamnose transport system ATP-binding protein|nr:Ribose import ATP-binding protein RbsA [Actinomycetes bacterium]